MPKKRQHSENRLISGKPIDVAVAETLGLYTYDLAAKALRLKRETIRQYGRRKLLEVKYLDQQALVTRESMESFEKSHR